MKRKILHAVAAFLLTLGPAAAVGAATGTIDLTGPDSTNKVTHDAYSDVEVDNDTKASITNNNPQSASSGDATTEDNTTSDDVSSGMASNSSSLSVGGSVDNSSSTEAALSCGCGNGGDNDGDISNTGPDSTNIVSFKSVHKVDVHNNTWLSVSNNNAQSATSGNVNANHNTTVGSATSGDASNESTTEISFSVTN